MPLVFGRPAVAIARFGNAPVAIPEPSLRIRHLSFPNAVSRMECMNFSTPR